ncbi:MAG TPA: GyrI-like domain-containing protein [Actinomycetota bacterium]
MDYEIEVKDLPDRYVVTARTTTTPDKVGETFGALLPQADAEILNAGTRPTGPAFAIYHVYRDDQVDMELGFPVDEPIPTTEPVIGRELPATIAAVTFHHGPYTALGDAYRAVEAWMHENGARGLRASLRGVLGRPHGRRGLGELEHGGRLPAEGRLSSTFGNFFRRVRTLPTAASNNQVQPPSLEVVRTPAPPSGSSAFSPRTPRVPRTLRPVVAKNRCNPPPWRLKRTPAPPSGSSTFRARDGLS